jgi:hypothetical protein
VFGLAILDNMRVEILGEVGLSFERVEWLGLTQTWRSVLKIRPGDRIDHGFGGIGGGA